MTEIYFYLNEIIHYFLHYSCVTEKFSWMSHSIQAVNNLYILFIN